MGSTKPFNPNSPTSKGLALSIAVKRLRKQKLNKVQEQFAREHADMIRAAMPEAEKKVDVQNKRADKRKEGLQELKEGFKDFNRNGFEQLGDMAKGAISAFGLGDKKSMIKGALENANPKERFVNNMKAHGKMIKGAIKAIFNDLKWYDNYPEATKEMIGPNFNTRIGAQDDLLDIMAGGESPSINSAASVKIAPVIGDDSDGAVTSAFTRLYTAIRQANSGNVNWTQGDLVGYIYNARAAIILYMMGCRALRELNKFSILDKGVPYIRFAAMGLDYVTFSTNAADLRNRLLNFRTTLRCLAIPNLDIFKRTAWLFDNAFWDSNDAKHQTYYFVPTWVHGYRPDNDQVVTLYTPTAVSSTGTGSTYTAFLSALQAALDTLTIRTDKYSIMSGDIVKAYGTDGTYHLPEIPDLNEMPKEGYSEEVLTQIQNAYIPKYIDGIATHTLAMNSTNTGLTEVLSYFDSSIVTYAPDKVKSATFINMYKDNITNLDVIGSTRFVSFTDHTGTGNTAHNIVAYGTEVFDVLEVYYFDYSSGNSNYHKVKMNNLSSLEIINFTTGAQAETTCLKLGFWSNMDWAPRILLFPQFFLTNSTTATTTQGFMLWDFNNYAKIDTIAQLRSIHNVATMSLYYTPLLVRNTNVVAY